MLGIPHGRRRAYSDFGVYGEIGTGHVSTAPSLETNMDTLGIEGPSRRGSQAGQRSTSPSPSSRSRSKERRPSTKNATGHLAAHAFNLMVTVPQNISNEGGAEEESAISVGKLTPDLLCSNHYEADISDQSDTCLNIPAGFVRTNIFKHEFH
ncbi:uncharacterized protein [Palaemon carinicauda]|uniref:uncharacterized protein n=1 Tax=Palaemon carinicauda TaxID=392227 RepID=UPI0035B57215